MFNLSNEIVCQIITKAKEIGVARDLYLPGDPESPELEGAIDVLAEDKNDLTRAELRDTINQLEPDQQEELIALMFIGGGDFEKEEWLSALSEARKIPVKKRADFLLSKPMLADFLQDGLAAFGFACEE